MSNRIDALQWLRAIAAYWVLFTHVLQRLQIQPFGYNLSGQWGVDIFFILSGFIIFYTTKEGSSWSRFAKKRIFRIFPLYLTCLIAYYSFYHFTNGLELSALEWIQNIMMIPFSDTIGFHSLVVAQAWSTCYELYFYAMLCILLMLKIRKRFLLPILIGLFVTGFVLSHYNIITDYGFGRYIISLIGVRHIILFCVGIILSYIYQKCPPQAVGHTTVLTLWNGLIRLLCRPIPFVFINIIYILSLFTSYNFMISLLISSAIFSFYLYGGILCSSAGILNRMMVYLGDISFSVYLVHSLLIWIFLYFGLNNLPSLLSVTILSTTLISSITYYSIEQPFVKIAKK